MIHREYKHHLYRWREEVLDSVVSGESDVALMFGSIVMWTIHQKYQGKLAISEDFVPDADNIWNIAIVVKAEDKILKADLDRAIEQLWTDGYIPGVFAEYGIKSSRPAAR